MDNIPKLLLTNGTKFYNFGRFAIKRLLLIGAAVWALIQLISLIGWGVNGLLLSLLAESIYSFVNLLVVAAYISILIGLVGVPFYFAGLHYLGLGQIAENTKK